MHGSTTSLPDYLANHRKLLEQFEGFRSLKRGLWSLRSAGTLDTCVVRAQSLTAYKAKIRTTTNRVLTPNAYSRDYLPPNPVSAREACRQIFRLRAAWTAKAERNNALALSTYITLLTVHPFEDGNGRTCRMLLAADAMGGDRCDPISALAGLLLKGQQSMPFHLSARCARAGDFHMLAECHRSAMTFASANLTPILLALDSVPSDNYDKQSYWAERLFMGITEGLHQGNSGLGTISL
ncbi:Fic family protein [Xanthomonas hyacinthi]